LRFKENIERKDFIGSDEEIKKEKLGELK